MRRTKNTYICITHLHSTANTTSWQQMNGGRSVNIWLISVISVWRLAKKNNFTSWEAELSVFYSWLISHCQSVLIVCSYLPTFNYRVLTKLQLSVALNFFLLFIQLCCIKEWLKKTSEATSVSLHIAWFLPGNSDTPFSLPPCLLGSH